MLKPHLGFCTIFDGFFGLKEQTRLFLKQSPQLRRFCWCGESGKWMMKWWNADGFNGFCKFTWNDDPRIKLICIFVSFLHQEWNGTFCCDMMWSRFRQERKGWCLYECIWSRCDPVVIVWTRWNLCLDIPQFVPLIWVFKCKSDYILKYIVTVTESLKVSFNFLWSGFFFTVVLLSPQQRPICASTWQV